MGSPTEFWVGSVLVFLYEDGFTLFFDEDGEFTAYWALLAVILVAAALLLIAKGVRPATLNGSPRFPVVVATSVPLVDRAVAIGWQAGRLLLQERRG
ncbi:MAG: hypothetical protein FJ290_20955, partial [Planctomycetes bacterium]|nr:hypothetical protein [Planctomycetota bacterium]